MQSYKHLLIECTPPEVRLTLNSPPLNVLNMAMMEELERALGEAAHMDGARVLVMDAAGKAFCAGVDVKDHMGDSAGPMLKLFHRVIRHLWHYDLPTVAVVHGAALGGGCELALSCDIVIAGEEATLGQPEVAVGVFPPPAVVLFPRLCGLSAAKELLMTGRIIGADEAKRLGLVSKVAGQEALAEEVRTVVKALSKKSLPVLELTRQAMLGTLDLPIDEALARAESLYLEELATVEDSEEGLKAFLEKRKPVWKDR